METNELNEINISDGRAKLAELAERARSGEPQVLTCKGKDDVVLISRAEWERLKPPAETLGAYLSQHIRSGTFEDVEIERLQGSLRTADFG